MSEHLPIPTNPTALSAPWLTATLRQWARARAATSPTFSVRHFTATPLGENKGFYGEPVRLTLDYQGQNEGADLPLPRTLIAKFSTTNPDMRQRAISSYLREVRFYQQLAPHSGMPVPICYYADIDLQNGDAQHGDPQRGDHILLLQEIAPANAITRIGGCTEAQARLAIQAITKLHSRWWGRTDDPALDWLHDAPISQDDEAMRQQYEQWWSAFYAAAEAQLPADFIEFSRTLGNHHARLRRHLFHSAPRTLIHRDLQLDNLIFAGQGSDEQVTILDWQFLSRGRSLFDIAYFLSENLNTPSKRKSRIELDLLADYHRTLCEQGVVDYTFEDCLQDFRLALLQRHIALVSTIAAMPFSAEQRHIHLNLLLPRNIAAIRDHRADMEL